MPAVRRRISGRILAGIAVVLVMWLASASGWSKGPEQEFLAAFNAVNDLAQPLLDELGRAEKEQGRAIATRRARGQATAGADNECRPPYQEVGTHSGFILGLCVSDAAYFSPVGDPPATRMLRETLAIVKAYADLLGELHETPRGVRNLGLERRSARVNAMIADALDTAQRRGNGSNSLAARLLALQPVVDAAGRATEPGETARLVREGAPMITRVLAGLQQTSDPMFQILISTAAASLTRRAAADPKVAEPDLQLIEGYRSTVAGFTVLLEQLTNLWGLLIIEIDAPASGPQGEEMTRRSREIRINAEMLRQHLGRLLTTPRR